MTEIEITSLDYNDAAYGREKSRLFRRFKMAFRCLFSEQASVIYKNANSEYLYCNFVNFTPKIIGFIMVKLGEDLYRIDSALDEANEILN